MWLAGFDVGEVFAGQLVVLEVGHGLLFDGSLPHIASTYKVSLLLSARTSPLTYLVHICCSVM